MRARQKVSRAGVELIKSFEGLRTLAARLPDGRWTLGYGHTFSAREGARVTQEDADALLRFDLLPVVDSINNLVLVPLNQNQFDALVSFCFNIGTENFAQSTVLKRINEGRTSEAALAMDSWRSAEFNGQTYVLAPLIRRRAAEKNLFLTPDDISHQAATLGRPVEDVGEAPASPDVASYLNPYAMPLQAATERQVIDLSSPPPRTEAAPEAVVENLPQGFIPSAMREATPAPSPYAAPYVAPELSQLSAEAQAALAHAQAEQRLREEAQRLDAQRQADAIAQAVAARAAEEARLREDARLREEAHQQEMQRQEAARLEQMRLEQARAEQARIEQARIEQERLDQWRQEQARLEAERVQAANEAANEAARQEAIRAEAARQDAERQAQIRQMELRWEQERLERERLEAQRLEAERLETERAEAQRVEAERLEAERAEQARLEEETRAQEVLAQQQASNRPAPVVSDDEAEKARKAEAAAALMRLYSPYGGGSLGRPLAPPLARPAPVPEPEPQPTPSLENVVSTPTPEPEPEADLAFTNHSVISPSAVESTPFEISSRAEDPPADDEDDNSVVDFTPIGSPATMPPPVIMALNPYARPIPVTPIQPAHVQAAVETVIEVPRPAPVNMSAPSNAPLAAETNGLHWREQLQRPLPQDYQAPEAQATETEQPFLRAGPSSNFQTAHYEESYEDDNEAWMMNGDRIALSSEEPEDEGDSVWQMIGKTLWLIMISAVGLGSLGVAAGFWWQANNDSTVIRSGFVQTYTGLSIGTAAVGILFVSISVWLIMKRLGGLKD